MSGKSRNQKKWHIYAQPEVLPATVIFTPLLLIMVAAYVIA